MPTDILIYAIVAAVMIFWLRNVIGTRHGEEIERPNPLEIIPSMNGKNTLESGLAQIARADQSFDKNDFQENASDAFTIIVTAFADGDLDTLKDMCGDTVYNAFDNEIKAREKRGEIVSTEIHAVRKNDIVAAGIDKKRHAFISIRFTADETYVIEDKKSDIIAGHPDRVTEMTDKWTFTRDIKSSDPRWFLSKTEDDVIEEDGKTPLPDAG